MTAVLGLDATVVLLTPAAFAAAAKARLPGRPAGVRGAHLANSASLLLPISSLTNLLAFRATELSFAGFAARMALPWAVAIAIEWGVLRRAFRRALEAPGRAPEDRAAAAAARAAGGARVHARGVRRRGAARARCRVARRGRRAADARHRSVWRAVDLPLLGFVLGLGLIVRALADAGLGTS